MGLSSVFILLGMATFGSSAKCNRSAENCFHTKYDIWEDAQLSAVGLLEKYGYPTEVHKVRTGDGYILEMHRIVPDPDLPFKGVAFLQHGLLSSSADWILMGTKKGLPYILSDLGYDVWLGNSRGNTYSRKHTSLNPKVSKFWEFSWHEMGVYDIPAAIDYVLSKTGEKSLFYIGHSQGTTQFFVMASERPEYNQKIRAMFSLSPVVFVGRVFNPFVQLLSVGEGLNPGAFSNLVGAAEFLPNTKLQALLGLALCKDEAVTQDLCRDSLFLISGYNSAQLNKTMIPVIMGHSPAGSSTNQLVHFFQGVASKQFRKFDYGRIRNWARYGSFKPPEYNLTKITCPVSLHYSSNDWLLNPKDVDILYGKLRNRIGKFLVPLPKFNHLDFMWAIDVKKLLYDKVISLMEKY